MRRGLVGLVRRHPTIAAGGALLILLVLIALFAPWLGTVDPTTLAPARRTRPPSTEHWFGTDMLGRDLYSRVIYGTRVSLTVGFAVATLASSIGLAIGLMAGFVRWIDAILMRVMDGLMSIPPILLAVALMALTRGSVGNVVIAITIAEIPRVRGSCAALFCHCASNPMWTRQWRQEHARRQSSCATSCRTRSRP